MTPWYGPRVNGMINETTCENDIWAVFKPIVDPCWLLLVDDYFGGYTVLPNSLWIIIISHLWEELSTIGAGFRKKYLDFTCCYMTNA